MSKQDPGDFVTIRLAVAIPTTTPQFGLPWVRHLVKTIADELHGRGCAVAVLPGPGADLYYGGESPKLADGLPWAKQGEDDERTE